MSRIAVTGASGFVGRHLIPVLAGQGHEIRMLVRSGGAETLGSDVSSVLGDARDADALRRLVDGTDVLIHLASSFSPQAVDQVEAGTRAAVQAAHEAGLDRLVFVSCLAAHAAARSPFLRAKWKSEQLVRASGVPYVVLRSSLVLGPEDSVIDPLASLIRAFPAVPLPGSGGQRSQPIDVDDLARCIALAVTEKDLLNTEVSVAGPTFLTLRQLVDLIEVQLGLSKPRVLVPARLMSAAGGVLPVGVAELFAGPRLGGPIESPATSPGIVKRIFGFEPKSIPEQLSRYLEPAGTLA